MSMTVLAERAPATAARRALLAFLPGAHMRAADYLSHGFFDAVRRREPAADLLAVETGTDCYLDQTLAGRLHQEVLAAELARAPAALWLAGISLGGFGALLYAQAHPESVRGLLLMAPFIGSRGLIDEVEAAGGIRRWRPQAVQLTTPERRLLAWLGGYRPQHRGAPEIHLAYGEDDRFAAAHRLLAGVLPADKIITLKGGHDWPTWEALWDLVLRGAPLTDARA